MKMKRTPALLALVAVAILAAVAGSVKSAVAAGPTITIWADGQSSQSGQWAAMSQLTIEGASLADDAFKPGAKLHFTSDSYGSTPYAYTYGCSGTGSDADMLDYESPGVDTDIEVSESDEPGMVHLTITATHSGYGTQLVHSEIDVVVPQ